MKKFKELSKGQKGMIVIYMIAILVSLGFYIEQVNDPENYKTTITCGREVYVFDKKMPDSTLESMCPESFIQPKFGINYAMETNISELIKIE